MISPFDVNFILCLSRLYTNSCANWSGNPHFLYADHFSNRHDAVFQDTDAADLNPNQIARLKGEIVGWDNSGSGQ